MIRGQIEVENLAQFFIGAKLLYSDESQYCLHVSPDNRTTARPIPRGIQHALTPHHQRKKSTTQTISTSLSGGANDKKKAGRLY